MVFSNFICLDGIDYADHSRINDEDQQLITPNVVDSIPSRPFRRQPINCNSILDDANDFTVLSIEDSCLEMEIAAEANEILRKTFSRTDIQDTGNSKSKGAKSKRKQTSQKKGKNKRIRTTSKFIGVCWNKSNSKWQSQIYIPKIGVNGQAKYKYLGLFTDEKKAALEYDRQMKLMNPSLSRKRLNFP